MSYEMTILALVTLFYLFSWLPVWLAKYQVYGGSWLASNRDAEDLQVLPVMAQRAMRAHADLKEHYPPFAVAILLLAFSGGFTRYTAMAAVIFLFSRLVYMPAYIFGVPWLRSSAWLSGFMAELYLLAMVLVVLV
ncbi:MAG: MAPEG family protein [Gammaproteobacteria bacterium]|nr:MAPEG family protein [Gammaproteobacteria bacterium]